jgi:hypothetical protein
VEVDLVGGIELRGGDTLGAQRLHRGACERRRVCEEHEGDARVSVRIVRPAQRHPREAVDQRA